MGRLHDAGGDNSGARDSGASDGVNSGFDQLKALERDGRFGAWRWGCGLQLFLDFAGYIRMWRLEVAAGGWGFTVPEEFCAAVFTSPKSVDFLDFGGICRCRSGIRDYVFLPLAMVRRETWVGVTWRW